MYYCAFPHNGLPVRRTESHERGSSVKRYNGGAGQGGKKLPLPDLFGYHTCPGLASHRLNGHVWAQLVRHHVRLALAGWLAAKPDSYELSARPPSISFT